MSLATAVWAPQQAFGSKPRYEINLKAFNDGRYIDVLASEAFPILCRIENEIWTCETEGMFKRNFLWRRHCSTSFPGRSTEDFEEIASKLGKNVRIVSDFDAELDPFLSGQVL